jgi:dTDP-4-dehydrorhamnose 3,5-epimerase
MYKCNVFYNKASEGGIRFDDASLGINWQVEAADALVSEKDLVLPSFNEALNNFEF